MRHTVTAPWIELYELILLAKGPRQRKYLAGELPWSWPMLDADRDGKNHDPAWAARNGLLDRVRRRYGWAPYRANGGQAILVIGATTPAGAVALIRDLCAVGKLDAKDYLSERERKAFVRERGATNA